MMTPLWNDIANGPAGARSRLGTFADDESGATSIEYGLIVALVFLAIVSAIRAYTDAASDMYNEVSTTLDEATP